MKRTLCSLTLALGLSGCYLDTKPGASPALEQRGPSSIVFPDLQRYFNRLCSEYNSIYVDLEEIPSFGQGLDTFSQDLASISFEDTDRFYGDYASDHVHAMRLKMLIDRSWFSAQESYVWDMQLVRNFKLARETYPDHIFDDSFAVNAESTEIANRAIYDVVKSYYFMMRGAIPR